MNGRLLPAIVAALWSLTAAAQVNIDTNQVGRLTSVGNGLTRTFFQYDEQARMVAAQHVQESLSRTFTTAYGYPVNTESTVGPGIVAVSETFPDGERIVYSFDAGGQQTAMRSVLGTTIQDIVRNVRTNALGEVTRFELGNGTITTRTYDDAGHQGLIRTTTVDSGAQKIQEYVYAYDPDFNVSAVTDGVRADQSVSYTYDSLDRLTAVKNSEGNPIEAYAYDAIGNLIQKGALNQTYNAGGRPHALLSSGGIPYRYDPNGNVTSIGPEAQPHFQLEWNSENMPVRVTAGSQVTQKSFVGESLWKKLEQGVTTNYLPGMRLENGVARKYYGGYAERLEDPNDRQLRFYHPDHLGSSSVMTDQNGNVIRRVSYWPWGTEREVDQTLPNPFIPKLQFNFKEKDVAGFYDYGARLYNPATGRWLSPDSSLGDGLNRYAYVQNNPTSRTDPTGHQSQDSKKSQDPKKLPCADGGLPGGGCEEPPDGPLDTVSINIVSQIYFDDSYHLQVIPGRETTWIRGDRLHSLTQYNDGTWDYYRTLRFGPQGVTDPDIDAYILLDLVRGIAKGVARGLGRNALQGAEKGLAKGSARNSYKLMEPRRAANFAIKSDGGGGLWSRVEQSMKKLRVSKKMARSAIRDGEQYANAGEGLWISVLRNARGGKHLVVTRDWDKTSVLKVEWVSEFDRKWLWGPPR